MTKKQIDELVDHVYEEFNEEAKGMIHMSGEQKVNSNIYRVYNGICRMYGITSGTIFALEFKRKYNVEIPIV